MKTCSVEECNGKFYAKEYCRWHYRRLHKPSGRGKKGPTPRPAVERFWEKVERREGCWGWNAATDKGGYANLYVEGSLVKAHRFSYELTNGPIPEGLVIDHICHNRSCLNPEHLRAVTQKQNNENRQGPQPNSTSGLQGVHWHKGRQKWMAHVKHNSRRIYLGYFLTIEEAEAAAVAKRNELFTCNDRDRMDHNGYPKEVAA